MKNLKIEHNGQVSIAIVSRPQALNALNREVMDELHELIESFYRDSNVRGLILTGEGEKAFVAGADIKELAILTQEQAMELANLATDGSKERYMTIAKEWMKLASDIERAAN